MDWKEVAGYVKQFAPVLGGAIAGPAGTAVGGVVSLIADAFGIESPEPSADEVMTAIQTDPEAAVKLKQIQTSHKEKLAELALDLDKAYLADVADARKAHVDRVKATGKADTNLYILAWIVVVGFFALCGVMIFKAVPENQASLILFGGLVAGFTQVMNFNFGSSRGSKEKTMLLGQRN